MPISHDEQRDKWNREHKNPYALVQMDKRDASGSVLWFIEFLKEKGLRESVGIEMGCGKGRNVLALAKEPWVAQMCGFDFSEIAITEAKKRAGEETVSHKTQFQVMDAIMPWEYNSNSFGFGIDCAASTDIETESGRSFAADEMFRVLKTGGYLLVMAMSEEDEYHLRMQKESPAEESNAFYHTQTGKFEKFFTAKELDSLHKKFALASATRHEGTVRFFNTPYAANLHWRIYQKPLE